MSGEEDCSSALHSQCGKLIKTEILVIMCHHIQEMELNNFGQLCPPIVIIGLRHFSTQS